MSFNYIVQSVRSNTQGSSITDEKTGDRIGIKLKGIFNEVDGIINRRRNHERS